LSVAVEHCRGVIKAGKPGFDPCQPTAVTAAKPTYHDGDGIRVRLTNTSAHPVDVTVLHVDARYAITALFPDPDEPQEHARLPPHSKPVEFKAELTATPAGLEHLLVIAVPVKPESEEMSFVSLAQSGIPDTASRGPSTALTQLLDEAAFGDTLRGSVRTDARLAATISTFSWTVKP
jgi:hypothetical protein